MSFHNQPVKHPVKNVKKWDSDDDWEDVGYKGIPADETVNDVDDEYEGIDEMKVRGIQRMIFTTKQISKPSHYSSQKNNHFDIKRERFGSNPKLRPEVEKKTLPLGNSSAINQSHRTLIHQKPAQTIHGDSIIFSLKAASSNCLEFSSETVLINPYDTSNKQTGMNSYHSPLSKFSNFKCFDRSFEMFHLAQVKTLYFWIRVC